MKIVWDKKSEIFVVYITALKILLAKLSIYSDKKAQIAFVLIRNVVIPNKYSDFAYIYV